jgi:DnaK suppressor protein
VSAAPPPWTDDGLSSEGQARLAGRIAAVLEDARAVLADPEGRAGTVELDQARVGRLSRMDALQQQQMAAAGRRRAELRIERLEAALERLHDEPEEVGWCPECGEAIGWRRLWAVPDGIFCVPCQQAREG